jgi:hypothetical protein
MADFVGGYTLDENREDVWDAACAGHELIPARNASLAAMQGSASESNVRYYRTWKHSPLKERNEQTCYSGRKTTESLGNVTVRWGKIWKGQGGITMSKSLSMYSITENIYCSQLSSVAIVCSLNLTVSHRIIQGKDCVLSPYVLSSQLFCVQYIYTMLPNYLMFAVWQWITTSSYRWPVGSVSSTCMLWTPPALHEGLLHPAGINSSSVDYSCTVYVTSQQSKVSEAHHWHSVVRRDVSYYWIPN